MVRIRASQLTWLLNIMNPSSLPLTGNQRLRIRFYNLPYDANNPSGGLVTGNTVWKDATGNNIPGAFLINQQPDPSGKVQWDNTNNEFLVALQPGESICLPCWGTGTGWGFFTNPVSLTQDRVFQPTIVVEQLQGYSFNATIVGQGFCKHRTSSALFVDNPYTSDRYMGSSYSYSCIYLYNYYSDCNHLLVLPWFRERYFPGINSGDMPDWSTSFIVVNAGAPGNINIQVKNLDGTLTDLTNGFNKYFPRLGAIYLTPSQFKTSFDSGPNPPGMVGRIEVRSENPATIPVCLGIQARFSKSRFSYGSHSYRIPSHNQCEPFHIIPLCN